MEYEVILIVFISSGFFTQRVFFPLKMQKKRTIANDLSHLKKKKINQSILLSVGEKNKLYVHEEYEILLPLEKDISWVF